MKGSLPTKPSLLPQVQLRRPLGELLRLQRPWDARQLHGCRPCGGDCQGRHGGGGAGAQLSGQRDGQQRGGGAELGGVKCPKAGGCDDVSGTLCLWHLFITPPPSFGQNCDVSLYFMCASMWHKRFLAMHQSWPCNSAKSCRGSNPRLWAMRQRPGTLNPIRPFQFPSGLVVPSIFSQQNAVLRSIHILVIFQRRGCPRGSGRTR